MHSKALVATSLAVVAAATFIESDRERASDKILTSNFAFATPSSIVDLVTLTKTFVVDGKPWTVRFSTMPFSAVVTTLTATVPAVTVTGIIPLPTDDADTTVAARSREHVLRSIAPSPQYAAAAPEHVGAVILEGDQTPSLTVPYALSTAVKSTYGKTSVYAHLPEETAATGHKVQLAKSTASLIITDAFKETLQFLPKPSSMPMGTQHYDAVWSVSQSSAISLAVHEGKIKKGVKENQKNEEDRVLSDVTSAAAGFTSASIAELSASIAKARESKALKTAKHKLKHIYKHAETNDSSRLPSPFLAMLGLLSVAVGMTNLVLTT